MLFIKKSASTQCEDIYPKLRVPGKRLRLRMRRKTRPLSRAVEPSPLCVTSLEEVAMGSGSARWLVRFPAKPIKSLNSAASPIQEVAGEKHTHTHTHTSSVPRLASSVVQPAAKNTVRSHRLRNHCEYYAIFVWLFVCLYVVLCVCVCVCVFGGVISRFYFYFCKKPWYMCICVYICTVARRAVCG